MHKISKSWFPRNNHFFFLFRFECSFSFWLSAKWKRKRNKSATQRAIHCNKKKTFLFDLHVMWHIFDRTITLKNTHKKHCKSAAYTYQKNEINKKKRNHSLKRMHVAIICHKNMWGVHEIFCRTGPTGERGSIRFAVLLYVYEFVYDLWVWIFATYLECAMSPIFL